MYNKIKSEKGFTGVDITIALIIILLLMSIIAILFFNITKTSKTIDRRSNAIYMATEIIEGLKAKEYENVKITGTEDNWVEVKNGNNNTIHYEINGETITIVENTQIDDGYTCYVSIYNYVPQNNNNENPENTNTSNSDLIKVLKVKVEYKVGAEIKNVELTTSIVRED